MTPSLHLTGVVGDEIAEADVRTFLAAHAGKPVELILNSPGGCAFTGAAVKAALEEHGRVKVRVHGLVASAASLIAMGAHRIAMHADAHLMIHDPSALTIGPAAAHRDAAASLDRIAETYARGYARATGHPPETVRAWMLAETWLNAEEALALHFADEIETGPERVPAVAFAGFDISAYRHPPEAVLRLLARNGGAADPREARKGQDNAG